MAERTVPRLLAIGGGGGGGEGYEAWLRGLAAAGVDGVQLRDKRVDDRELLALALAARRLLPATTKLLINGRLDVALAAGADGVHLPADGLPAAPLRGLFAGGAGGNEARGRRFGPTPLLGRSTHGLDEVAAAHGEGVDYVVFGPVFATPGKGPAVGLAALAEAARVGVPVLALGGMAPERVAEALAAGAHGVAALRAFATAEGARTMVAALAGATAGGARPGPRSAAAASRAPNR